MKVTRYLLLILLPVAIFSCENIEVNPNVDYAARVNSVVINPEFQTNKNLKSVKLRMNYTCDGQNYMTEKEFDVKSISCYGVSISSDKLTLDNETQELITANCEVFYKYANSKGWTLYTNTNERTYINNTIHVFGEQVPNKSFNITISNSSSNPFAIVEWLTGELDGFLQTASSEANNEAFGVKCSGGI